MAEPSLLRSEALRAARKRLPYVHPARLRERLKWVTDDPAEAYRIGAEEAQGEIVARLSSLIPTIPQEADRGE